MTNNKPQQYVNYPIHAASRIKMITDEKEEKELRDKHQWRKV